MSKPTEDFWEMAGMALVIFAVLGGMALIRWASGGK